MIIEIWVDEESHFDGGWFVHDPISYFLFVVFQQLLDGGFVGPNNSGVGIDERANIVSYGVQFALEIVDKLFDLS